MKQDYPGSHEKVQAYYGILEEACEIVKFIEIFSGSAKENSV